MFPLRRPPSMASSNLFTDPSAAIRRLLLAIVSLGLVGSGVELVLLEHYEDSWQLVPIFFIGLALAVVAGHVMTGSAKSLVLLRLVMGCLVVAGIIGIVLHYRGSMAFQLEMDPTQSGWPLFATVIRAKAPPTLAPGVMAQLGLLGLLYTYRHPAAGRALSDWGSTT
jgi:hypothetical protein